MTPSPRPHRLGTIAIAFSFACAVVSPPLSSPAWGRAADPPDAIATTATNSGTAAATVVGQMPLSVDAVGRAQVDVLLDGKGPLHFTVDSAASGVVLSQAAADRLHLREGTGKAIVGGIGRGPSRSVHVGTLRTAMFDIEDLSLALLPGVSGDGILGMAPFLRGRIEFDFSSRMLRAGPSGPTPDGFVAATGSLRQGLLIVPVRIDGVAATALVDTGTPLLIGNPQLQAALGLPAGDARLHPGGIFTDAFGQPRVVEQANFDHLRVGDITFSQPTLRFAEMPVLRALGLDDGPALILGIGQFAHMSAIAIDFPRSELQLRP